MVAVQYNTDIDFVNLRNVVINTSLLTSWPFYLCFIAPFSLQYIYYETGEQDSGGHRILGQLWRSSSIIYCFSDTLLNFHSSHLNENLDTYFREQWKLLWQVKILNYYNLCNSYNWLSDWQDLGSPRRQPGMLVREILGWINKNGETFLNVGSTILCIRVLVYLERRKRV